MVADVFTECHVYYIVHTTFGCNRHLVIMPWESPIDSFTVIPAHGHPGRVPGLEFSMYWMPAFAGMTN